MRLTELVFFFLDCKYADVKYVGYVNGNTHTKMSIQHLDLLQILCTNAYARQI